MEYRRIFAIYFMEGEEGYVSGISYYHGAKYLYLTEVYPNQYPDDEIPIPVLQIASIKTFPCKQAAQESIKKYALCENVEYAENLVVRELSYEVIELIGRCRNFMEERKKAQTYAELFRTKKFRCFHCGNTDIAEMVVGEKTYQLMDDHKTTNVDKRFSKEVTLYCNRCMTKIL